MRASITSPGFPLYEFLITPVIALGGPVFSNVSSLFAFLLSLVLFRRIVHHWDVSHAGPLLITYAFLPILWKNSAVTMDYVWGLLGILASLRLLQTNRSLLAGIALGCAAGTRITLIAFVVPFYFMFEGARRKEWLLFCFTAAVTTLVCFIPVCWSDDYMNVVNDFFNDIRNKQASATLPVYLYRIVFSIGLVGSLSIATVVLMERTMILHLQRVDSIIVSAAICCTGIVLFALLTDEREYLIPIMPALLILIAHIADRKQFLTVSAALLSFSIISVEVTDHDPDGPRFALSLQPGFVIKEMIDRNAINEKRLKLSSAVIPDSSVIMIGMGPVFGLENPFVTSSAEMEKRFRQDCYRSVQRKEIYFIYSLYYDQLKDFRRRGYTVYYWDEMKGYLQKFIGYDLDGEHVRPLTAR